MPQEIKAEAGKKDLVITARLPLQTTAAIVAFYKNQGVIFASRSVFINTLLEDFYVLLRESNTIPKKPELETSLAIIKDAFPFVTFGGKHKIQSMLNSPIEEKVSRSSPHIQSEEEEKSETKTMTTEDLLSKMTVLREEKKEATES